MESGKLERIRQILSEEYDGKMTEKDIKAFAKDLHLSVFECKFGLDDVFAIVDEYEERAKIEDKRWYYVFCARIDLLDNNEETAERLYESFMYQFDILEIFIKLYFENGSYISRKKLNEAKKKAFETFDNEILAACGITR